MFNKVYYLTLDTETATLPFVSEMGLTADEKKKVAIARPLVYDIGWTIATRSNGIVERKNFLVAETFSVPSIFNTAYYKDKRPKYLEMIRNGEITVAPWEAIMEELTADLEMCQYVCAYNAMFDFCRAIPFTELYMKHLYASDYYEWENVQRALCDKIAHVPYQKNDEKVFDNQNFHFRGKTYPMIDIWGLACQNILNSNSYRNACLENGWLTNSGTFFSTNAENAKRFLDNKFDFVEDHTALSDAEIETVILFYGMKVGKRITGIIYFPFRELGDTVEYLKNMKNPTEEMANNILNRFSVYLDSKEEETNYSRGLAVKMAKLENWIEENFD